MKRFFAVFMIAVMAIGPAAIANDFSLLNAPSTNIWALNGNWSATGYPGSTPTGYRMDRAVINQCVTNGVVFDNTCGDTAFSTYLDSRIVNEVVLDAATNDEPAVLSVTGDKLIVEHLVMKADGSGDFAYLAVTSPNALEVDRLHVIATGAEKARFDLSADFTVSQQTIIEGAVEFEITSSAVFNMGPLRISSGVLTRNSFGVPSC